MAPDSPSIPKTSRRVLPVALVLGALLLFWTRPQLVENSDTGQSHSASCLSNLSQISLAYAQYARDFDGKIPLAVDPEDRYHSQIWALDARENADYAGYLRTAPFLHVVLSPYVASRGVFHCPADAGWKNSRLIDPDLGEDVGLLNVLPSSFAKYGTSYYSWTKYGFDQMGAADIPDPARRALLFDGDLWHGEDSSRNGNRVGELFLDGHAALLTRSQHLAAAPRDE